MLAGPDSMTPLGISAAEVLELAEQAGPSENTLRWREDPLFFTHPNRGLSVGQTVRVTYSSGEVRFVESVRDGDIGWPPLDCTPRIEIDATVEYTTEDGLFRETWPAVLSASSKQAFTWTSDVDFKNTQGTLTEDFFTFDPDQKLESLSVGGRFEDITGGVEEHGVISIVIENGTIGSIAEWGDPFDEGGTGGTGGTSDTDTSG